MRAVTLLLEGDTPSPQAGGGSIDGFQLPVPAGIFGAKNEAGQWSEHRQPAPSLTRRRMRLAKARLLRTDMMEAGPNVATCECVRGFPGSQPFLSEGEKLTYWVYESARTRR